MVGLDVGTSGVKGIAISADGELLASAEEPYPLSTPHPGWAEQDPEDWWRAAQACLARLPDGPIGLSGPDARPRRARRRRPRPAPGDPLERPAHGRRVRRDRGAVGLERLIALTGNRALTGFTAPKLLWLRRHEPETYARIRHILLPKDYVRLAPHRRAGDRRRRRFGNAALRRRAPPLVGGGAATTLEIPLEWLPPAYESTEIAGAGDQAAAALGVGIASPGPVSVVLGTSGVVFAVLPAYAAGCRRRACTCSATRSPGRGTRWA